MSNLPDGVSISDIPGNRPQDIIYERAMEDDEGYGRAVRHAWTAHYLLNVTNKTLAAFLALDTEVLRELAGALDCEDVPSRHTYAERVVESGVWPAGRDDDDRPYE